MDIIDAHAHIYPDRIAEAATRSIGDFYGLPMHALGSVDALLASGAEIGVARYLVHSVAVKRGNVERINDFVAASCRQHPNFTGFLTLHPDMTEKEMAAEIGRAMDLGLTGIKLHPDIQRFDIDGEAGLALCRAAGGRLPILFHTGDPRYDYSRPDKLAKLAKLFPETLFIGAHFGGYSRWDELDCYLDTPNVYFDTSSSLFLLEPERAVELIRRHGAQRFFWGTDFPITTHRAELTRFDALPLTPAERAGILSDNIKKALRL